MIGIREIKDCIAQHNEQLFMFAYEHASEWLVLGLNDDARSYPLPELGLRCPELPGVAANYQCGVLALLLFKLLLFTHQYHFPNQSGFFIFSVTTSKGLVEPAYRLRRAILRAAAS